MRSLKVSRRRSVRGHLATVVVVVLVVFVAVGAVLAYQTWQKSQRSARADAAYLAEFAAGLVAENTAASSDQVEMLAANPGVAPLFADPTGCTLNFSLELFPGSHLDLVRPDGTVVCSSTEVPAAGFSHGGAAWLDDASTGPGPSELFVDEVTGSRAAAFVATVHDQGRVVGHVAVVVPTDELAGVIAETYGGRTQFEFALVDSTGVLSTSRTSGDTPGSVTEPLPGNFIGSHAVAGTAWTLVAGIDTDTAMAQTRAVLLRGILLGLCVLVVLAVAMAVVNRRIAKPLRALTRAVGGPRTRLATTLAAIDGPVEIEQLGARFEAVIADRDAYEVQLSHQALHDPLTGLANRALLVERLADALERVVRQRSDLAVLFLDLDRFKLVNDSLGHDAGDTVLLEVARRILGVIPASATLARFGGDEFVIVIETADDTDLQRVLDDTLAAVVAPIETATAVVRVTASIGVATSTPGRRAVDLIRDADNAMYAAKEAGRDRAERFTHLLHDRAAARLTITSDFRVALDRDELHLVYQPKVDLATGDIVGVESLLRWNHPALGSVPPSTFIPIAEETGAIISVGEFVLEQACRQAMKWRSVGINLNVAVNISGRQLTDGQLPSRVANTLAIYGLPAESLYLELTETLLMTDTQVTQRSIEELHDVGVRLSIDDFGTGYSSLAYLHRFPVDELKIDRTFINDLSASTDAPLVAAMIAMGKALGMQIVAEGVETADQASKLRALGCDRAQGYLFARPQHPDAIVNLLAHIAAPT
jgi:diguanylate cyclase (GGDEF)-like protein